MTRQGNVRQGNAQKGNAQQGKAWQGNAGAQAESSSPGVRLREAVEAMSGTVDRLSELSRKKYQNPYEALVWPESVEPEQDLFFSPEMTSLHGTVHAFPEDRPEFRRFAFQEAANFFSLNIHGEKALISGLAERMYRNDLLAISDYLHHFIDEENKHSVYFGGFCKRYAKLYRSRHVPFGAEADRTVSDFLFFAKALLFEEHADQYNVVQAKDDRLHGLARFINQAHHADEARHLVFNRAIVTALWETYAPGWTAATREDVRARIGQFFVTTWREYYNPDVYADCGFDDPWQVAEDAWCTPGQRAHRRRVSKKCLDFLLSSGVLEEEPADVF
ncbi:diiron oxygenase [Streptomyces mayonensis]|uniref:diiron oxygenase n=1 Tax=Streptomyces mayonensis TaxID=2750816 RepID=UPI001C1E31CC|nr:diiron oxygenase [Streptomyces sp. A108]MBU6533012.1 diiron oxygenase [Streptomyces sp. A108]